MKRLDIDFAPRSAAYWLLRFPAPGWLLAAVVLLVLGLGLARLGQAQAEAEVAQQALQRLQARLDSLQPARPRVDAARPTAAQLNAARAALRQLNLPWSELLDAVEAAAGAQVALLELRFDTTAQRLRGTAEARTAPAMLAFIERLQAHAPLGAAQLTAHQVNEADANRPLRFDFTAEWREVGR